MYKDLFKSFYSFLLVIFMLCLISLTATLVFCVLTFINAPLFGNYLLITFAFTFVVLAILYYSYKYEYLISDVLSGKIKPIFNIELISGPTNDKNYNLRLNDKEYISCRIDRNINFCPTLVKTISKPDILIEKKYFKICEVLFYNDISLFNKAVSDNSIKIKN